MDRKETIHRCKEMTINTRGAKSRLTCCETLARSTPLKFSLTDAPTNLCLERFQGESRISTSSDE